MPIPKPNKKEKKSDFISRCAGDSVMNKEYPDQKQRVAICFQKWKDKKKKASASIELDNDDEILFFLDEEYTKD